MSPPQRHDPAEIPLSRVIDRPFVIRGIRTRLPDYVQLFLSDSRRFATSARRIGRTDDATEGTARVIVDRCRSIAPPASGMRPMGAAASAPNPERKLVPPRPRIRTGS